MTNLFFSGSQLNGQGGATAETWNKSSEVEGFSAKFGI